MFLPDRVCRNLFLETPPLDNNEAFPMSTYPLLLALLLLAFALFTPANAQSPLTGAVSNAVLGVSFTAPDGWIGQETPAGYLYGSYTEPGIILVLTHELTNLDALRAEAQQGLQDENGTALFPSSPLESLGDNGLGGDFSGTIEGEQVQAYVAGFISPHGGPGVTVMAATSPGQFTDAHRAHVRGVGRSLRFSKPDTGPVTAQWQQLLAGTRLTYLWSHYSGGVDGAYVGGSERIVIDLCPQGYFNYAGNSSVAADAGFGGGSTASGFSSGNNEGSGSWQVAARGAQPLLRLSFHDGTVREYALTQGPKGETLLDGERYFRTTSSDSDPSHRPSCW